MFVGYDERDGIYWIYNKSNKQIFRSRDVRFQENNSKKVNNSENPEEWFTMDYSTIKSSEESLSDNTDEGDERDNNYGEDDSNDGEDDKNDGEDDKNDGGGEIDEEITDNQAASATGVE